MGKCRCTNSGVCRSHTLVKNPDVSSARPACNTFDPKHSTRGEGDYIRATNEITTSPAELVQELWRDHWPRPVLLPHLH